MKKRQLTPLGVQIKTRLNEIGMTQYELERKLGMSSNYLYLIMIGERSGKSYLDQLAKVLKIDPKVTSKSA